MLPPTAKAYGLPLVLPAFQALALLAECSQPGQVVGRLHALADRGRLPAPIPRVVGLAF